MSGIVDENLPIRLGGYPGAFRDWLGVIVEEFYPLRKGEQIVLDDDSIIADVSKHTDTIANIIDVSAGCRATIRIESVNVGTDTAVQLDWRAGRRRVDVDVIHAVT